MVVLGLVLAVVPVLLLVYAYALYPLLLYLTSSRKPLQLPTSDPTVWPTVTLVLPVHNEESAVAAALERLLALDYPEDRRDILVVSDASTDRTDEIVRSFSGRGVKLLRLAQRGGKTAAENAAGANLQGEIAVNTDATTRIGPAAVKALVRVFQDPTIGVASGRDVSVMGTSTEGNRGESGYVRYEMWVRSLETRMGTIVGASGCFYAIRRELFDGLFPEALSRDFASALIAVEHGLRAVSVEDAVCLVPRTRTLRSEYHRKVRTMARGLETLWYKRGAMVGAARQRFAFMLLSHKFVRWLVFLVFPLSPIGLGILSFRWPAAGILLGLGLLGCSLGGLAFLYPTDRVVPRPLAMAGFLVGSLVAGFAAWMKALRGELNPIWEPTRRS